MKHISPHNEKNHVENVVLGRKYVGSFWGN
jgi:hypothetical protein